MPRHVEDYDMIEDLELFEQYISQELVMDGAMALAGGAGARLASGVSSALLSKFLPGLAAQPLITSGKDIVLAAVGGRLLYDYNGPAAFGFVGNLGGNAAGGILVGLLGRIPVIGPYFEGFEQLTAEEEALLLDGYRQHQLEAITSEEIEGALVEDEDEDYVQEMVLGIDDLEVALSAMS